MVCLGSPDIIIKICVHVCLVSLRYVVMCFMCILEVVVVDIDAIVINAIVSINKLY